MNGVTIQPIPEGESYKYFGQDENLGYVGELNKDRVKRENIRRVKKICVMNTPPALHQRGTIIFYDLSYAYYHTASLENILFYDLSYAYYHTASPEKLDLVNMFT